MPDPRRIVIVGAGQAGGWTARTLRDQGFDGEVVLIGAEPHPPHERPPLSKEILLGLKPPESAYLWPEEALAEQAVDLRKAARAEAIDRARKRVALAGGEEVAYDRLMIATGAAVRRLAVPGAELEGVRTLRTLEDTAAIRAGLDAGGPLVVVGAGWIGLEVAAAARQSDLPVTVVEVADRVCARALTPDLSARLLALHRGHGVDVRLSMGVARIEGAGQVSAVVLGDGSRLPASQVVVGIGIVPDTALAEGAGLAVDNGIVVDEFGRTSDPDIFAAGDVTNHPNAFHGRRLRLESWENAQNQAIAAAKAMLDAGAAPYDEVPWFWSDQYDANIQTVGLPERWDRAVVRGEVESDGFVVFYLDGGLIVGAAAFNQGRDIRMARRLMAARKPVEPEALADPEVKLQSLLRG